MTREILSATLLCSLLAGCGASSPSSTPSDPTSKVMTANDRDPQSTTPPPEPPRTPLAKVENRLAVTITNASVIQDSFEGKRIIRGISLSKDVAGAALDGGSTACLFVPSKQYPYVPRNGDSGVLVLVQQESFSKFSAVSGGVRMSSNALLIFMCIRKGSAPTLEQVGTALQGIVRLKLQL